MVKSDFKFDLAQATRGALPQYDMGYYLSNEPLDWETELCDTAGKDVLTVAGSGDQPLMYAARGAKTIDTFDLVYNAHVITDFKVAALRVVDYKKYKDIISQMYDLDMAARKNPSEFQQIVHNMPNDSQTAIKQYTQSAPYAFSRERFLKVQIPATPTQYDSMRRNVTGPFNFIWSDLMHLSKHLDKEYDIINLSNIFAHYYMNDRTDMDVAVSMASLLTNNLKSGGYMICMGMINRPSGLELLDQIINKAKFGTAEIKRSPEFLWRGLLIQKDGQLFKQKTR